MGKILRYAIILDIVLIVFLFVKDDINKGFKALTSGAFFEEIKQGTVTIYNYDAKSKRPLENTEYIIIGAESKGVIDIVVTDETGQATSIPLDYGTKYMIKQSNVMKPYVLNEKEIYVEMNKKNHVVNTTNSMAKFVKDYQMTSDGEIDITEVFIPVNVVHQKPELPNGCEITALTAVLNYYGYKVTKTEMADKYLPKQPLIRKNNKLYGPNPYEAYAGNPRNQTGFFTYAPPIIKAADRYFSKLGVNTGTMDLSGSKKEELIELLDKGIPLVVWVTLDLTNPKINYSWYFYNTEKYFSVPVNVHTVVLNGYSKNKVYAMNPLTGQVTYDAKKFFESYEQLGSHAMMVYKRSN